MSHIDLEKLLSDATNHKDAVQQLVWWLEGTIKALKVVETTGAKMEIVVPITFTDAKPGPKPTEAKAAAEPAGAKPGPKPTETKAAAEPAGAKPGPKPTETKAAIKPVDETGLPIKVKLLREKIRRNEYDQKPTDVVAILSQMEFFKDLLQAEEMENLFNSLPPEMQEEVKTVWNGQKAPEPKSTPTPKDCQMGQGSATKAKPGKMIYTRLRFYMDLFRELIQHDGGLTQSQKEEIRGNHTLELASRILNGEERFNDDDQDFIQKRPFLQELQEMSKKKSSSPQQPRPKRRPELSLSERFEKNDLTLTYEQISSLRRNGRINGAREEQYYVDLEESRKDSMLNEQQVESLEQYYSDLLKRFEKNGLILTERQVKMLDQHYSGLLKRYEQKDRTLTKKQTQAVEQYCSYLHKRFQQKDETLSEEQIQSLEEIGRIDQDQVEKYYASTEKIAVAA